MSGCISIEFLTFLNILFVQLSLFPWFLRQRDMKYIKKWTGKEEVEEKKLAHKFPSQPFLLSFIPHLSPRRCIKKRANTKH